MENKADLKLRADELWSQAMTIKQIADLKIEAVKYLEKYLKLREEANSLYHQVEVFSQNDQGIVTMTQKEPTAM